MKLMKAFYDYHNGLLDLEWDDPELDQLYMNYLYYEHRKED